MDTGFTIVIINDSEHHLNFKQILARSITTIVISSVMMMQLGTCMLKKKVF